MAFLNKVFPTRKSWIDAILYVIVLIAFLATSDIVNGWLLGWSGETMQSFFNTLTERPWLTVSHVSVFLVLTSVFVINHWYDCYRPRTRIMAFILTAIILVSSIKYWDYLPIIGPITFFHLILVCIIAGLLSIIVRKRKPDNSGGLGKKFTIDNPDETPKVDPNRKAYADALVERIIGTDLDREAFSVGIAGEWGTGKTAFLKAIESSLKSVANEKIASIIWFQPWNSSTTGQIVTDFFNALIEGIGPHYSAVKKPLLKYAELLNAVDAQKPLVYLAGLFDKHREKSLSSIKESVSQYLRDYDKIIPVIIDDMDRLTSQEIADVLKLIRNTADFPKVVYIAAYDKNYVSQQLKSRGANDPSHYLEKFFSVEFVMPKMEDFYQYNVFVGEAKQMATNPMLIRYLDRMPGRTRGILCEAFDNFRQVKRFARIFVHDAEFFASKYSLDQHISTDDLLLLKILFLKDSSLYFTMEREQNKLMYRSKDEWRGIYPLKLKKRIFDKEEKEIPGIKSYQGEPIEGLSREILEALFTLSDKKDPKSLVNSESYPLYFALDVSSRHISVYELKKFIADSGDLWAKYKEWEDGGKLNSLYYHLLSFKPENMNENTVKRYISLVVKLLPDLNTQDDIISRALMSHIYHSSLVDMLKKHTESEFETVIKGITLDEMFTSFAYMARALVNIYEREDGGEQRTGDSGSTLLSSTGNVQRLLVLNFQQFVSMTAPDADELFRDDSVLQGVVKASVVSDYYQEDDVTAHTNLISEAMLQYFSKHKGKKKDYASKKYNVPADTPPEFEDMEAETKQEEKGSMFGDGDLYKKILDTCFED